MYPIIEFFLLLIIGTRNPDYLNR